VRLDNAFCVPQLTASKVQIARQSCELLLEIIDSLLDYSKLEASAVKLEKIPVFLEDVFAESVELMHSLVGASDLEGMSELKLIVT
jgi:signal transduction histidine kinase